MLKLLSTIIGRPVISQRDGRRVTTVVEAVGDSATAKVVAYKIGAGPSLLSTTDVLAYLDDGLVVSDADALQPESELVRVKQLGDTRTKFLGSKVVTEQGKRLGTVNDILIETDGHFLIRLHVRPSWPARLFANERIVSRERIVRLSAREVVVRYDEKAPVSAEPEIAQ